MIEITRVDVEQIIDLRHAVLRIGLPRSEAYFPGDAEPTTLHLAAKTQNRVIGCATILLNEWNGHPACQLRGMAVDPAHQRFGLGSKLLADVHQSPKKKPSPCSGPTPANPPPRSTKSTAGKSSPKNSTSPQPARTTK